VDRGEALRVELLDGRDVLEAGAVDEDVRAEVECFDGGGIG